MLVPDFFVASFSDIFEGPSGYQDSCLGQEDQITRRAEEGQSVPREMRLSAEG